MGAQRWKRESRRKIKSMYLSLVFLSLLVTHRGVLFFFNIHFSPSTGPGRREGQDVAPGLQRGRGPARDPRAPFECGTTNSLVGKAGSELEKKEILKERRRMSQNDAITRLDPRETIIMVGGIKVFNFFLTFTELPRRIEITGPGNSSFSHS